MPASRFGVDVWGFVVCAAEAVACGCVSDGAAETVVPGEAVVVTAVFG